jgi:pyruvate dehydrogenase E2 component (dihydrolipoamide acetyltransferase)
MAEIVTMPKLGFDMAEGTLVRWVVAEGESVEKGAILAEIETDKATVEVESSHSGVIRRHLVQEGTVVPINAPIAVIAAPDEEVDVDQFVESIAPTAETGLRPEAPVEEQEALPKDSAVEETAAKAEQTAEKSEDRKVEKELATSEASPAMPAREEAEPSGDGRLPEGVRASPLARKMAEERGIELRKIQGSGPRGRITRSDVESFREPVTAVQEKARPVVPVISTEPREDVRIPVSRLRAAIGRRMVQSKQQVPHFYVTHEYDMAQLAEMRKQVNEMLPEDEKISVNDFIIKAVALTLREFPNLNAALDEKNNEVVQYGQVNIGVAVAVQGGLLTVVCRDADQKSLRLISREVREKAGRAREGKVRPDDIEGSTFSISNMGMFDVEHFIAIINPPEAAILAVGSAVEVPVVRNGEIVPGVRMKATISVDHRVSDGAEGARFMQSLEKYLQEPLRLMI